MADDRPTGDAADTLAAWRARGADRLDPVRFRYLEALARRTATHDGAARRLLDDRLARAMETYGEAVAAMPAPSPALPRTVPSRRAAAAPRGALGQLADELARQAASPPSGGERASVGGEALRHARRTWTRLHAAQRLDQALSKAPQQAGPLNSLNLVHRTLRAMRELSPEYLAHFMAHVDALGWLEQAAAASPGGGARGGTGDAGRR